jgi:predicted lipoprotein with Yx(FWY)xxD motif
LSSSPSSTVVTTRDTPLGRILVDAQGRTLYLFAKDTGPASMCSGTCLSYWPAVPVTGRPHAAGGASATSVAVITGSAGSQQLSYAGHPLYYFVGDKQPGQTSGQGLDQFGAEWYVLGPSGSAVTAAPSTAGGTSSGGGYGY